MVNVRREEEWEGLDVMSKSPESGGTSVGAGRGSLLTGEL